jgi:hypothetical protein
MSQGGKEAVLFWKKGPKNFCLLAGPNATVPPKRIHLPQRKEQKFFGPFFQKRTALLPCSHENWRE